jgi:hypothetical protein
MMGIAQIPIRHPTAYGNYCYGQTVIADIIPNLFQATQGWEVRDRVRENVVSFGGEACSDSRHILFGNTCIEEPIGKLLREGFHHGITEVANHEKDTRVTAGLQNELLDEGGSHGAQPSWPRAAES